MGHILGDTTLHCCISLSWMKAETRSQSLRRWVHQFSTIKTPSTSNLVLIARYGSCKASPRDHMPSSCGLAPFQTHSCQPDSLPDVWKLCKCYPALLLEHRRNNPFPQCINLPASLCSGFQPSLLGTSSIYQGCRMAPQPRLRQCLILMHTGIY